MPVATDPTANSAAPTAGFAGTRNMSGVLAAVSRGAAITRRLWAVGAPKRGSRTTMTTSDATDAARGSMSENSDQASVGAAICAVPPISPTALV